MKPSFWVDAASVVLVPVPVTIAVFLAAGGMDMITSPLDFVMACIFGIAGAALVLMPAALAFAAAMLGLTRATRGRLQGGATLVRALFSLWALVFAAGFGLAALAVLDARNGGSLFRENNPLFQGALALSAAIIAWLSGMMHARDHVTASAAPPPSV